MAVAAFVNKTLFIKTGSGPDVAPGCSLDSCSTLVPYTCYHGRQGAQLHQTTGVTRLADAGQVIHLFCASSSITWE